jgi:O-antigen/teichoic acid export membrane protein
MKEYASFQAIYGAILIGSLGIFFLLKLFSFKAVLFPIYFAFGTVSLLILFLFRKYLQPKFDKQKRKILIKYSLFSFLGGIAFTFYTNVDKILINRWMETKDVGIYRAYYFASINLVWLFFNMFNIVFFPAASKYKRKKALFNQINKSIPCLIVLGVPFIFLIEGIIIKFYGSKYPVNLVWMSLFSVSAICVCLDGIYGWFFNSLGISGIKITAFAAIVLASVNIFLNVIFIPLLGITGAIIGIFIPFLVSIILMLLLGRKYVVDN